MACINKVLHHLHALRAPKYVYGTHFVHECTIDFHTLIASNQGELLMSEHVYKIIELVGSSTKGTDAAIQNAISRASESLKNLDWFEVVETRGHIEDGRIAHYQVTLKVGFRLEN